MGKSERSRENGSWRAIVRIKPGTTLDELLLNLFPLVEAGVLDLTVDPAERVPVSDQRCLVFEDCSPFHTEPSRRPEVRIRGQIPSTGRNILPQCLEPSSEVVPTLHTLLWEAVDHSSKKGVH